MFSPQVSVRRGVYLRAVRVCRTLANSMGHRRAIPRNEMQWPRKTQKDTKRNTHRRCSALMKTKNAMNKEQNGKNALRQAQATGAAKTCESIVFWLKVLWSKR